jgi:DNA adenine methylase
MKPGREDYYRVRHRSPDGLPDVVAAARFIYLNHYCFNGLYRTNRHGEFNVPFGRAKRDRPIDEAQILAAANLLHRAKLMHGDFAATLKCARPGDFVYLDPPYVVSRRRVFREYTSGSFSQADFARLAAALDDLHAKHVVFVITYADCKEARIQLKKWNPRRIRTRRNIAGFSGDRRTAYEVIATNIA